MRHIAYVYVVYAHEKERTMKQQLCCMASFSSSKLHTHNNGTERCQPKRVGPNPALCLFLSGDYDSVFPSKESLRRLESASRVSGLSRSAWQRSTEKRFSIDSAIKVCCGELGLVSKGSVVQHPPQRIRLLLNTKWKEGSLIRCGLCLIVRV